MAVQFRYVSEASLQVKVNWLIGRSHVSLVRLVLVAAIVGWLLGLMANARLNWRTRAPRPQQQRGRDPLLSSHTSAQRDEERPHWSRPLGQSRRRLVVEDNGSDYRWTLVATGGERLAQSPSFASYQEATRAP
jgi:hypothetical protein